MESSSNMPSSMPSSIPSSTPSTMSPPKPVKTTQEHELVMIDLGDHIKVTRAAFLTLIAGIIVSIVVAFVIPVWGPLVGLVILLLAMLWAYSINCIQVGHCYAWGWILAVLYIINAAFMLVKLFSVDGNDLKKLTSKMSPKGSSPKSGKSSRK